MRREAIPALTGVRFLAALAVVVYHLAWFHLASFPPELVPLVALGRDGVDLFFVLSGFVLAYNYADWFSTGIERRWAFLWLRVARIYPLALVALAVMVPIALLTDPRLGQLSPAALRLTFVFNALLVQTWIPLPAIITSSDLWLGPSWSISVEMLCYIFLPPLLLVVTRHLSNRRAVVLTIGALWIVGTVVLLLAPESLVAVLYYAPPLRAAEFVEGLLLGVYRVRSGPRSWRFGDVALVGCALTFAALALRPNVLRLAFVDWYVLAFPLAVGIVAVLGFSPSSLGNTLGNGVAVALGDASYALYLLHWPAFALAATLSQHQPLPIGADVVLLGVLVVLSLASYRWLEVPSRRWLRDHQPRWPIRRMRHIPSVALSSR